MTQGEPHPLHLLLRLARGEASAAEETQLRQHLSACAGCSAQLELLQSTVRGPARETARPDAGPRLAESDEISVVGTRRIWKRIEAQVTGPGRFDAYADDVAELLGTSREESVALLRSLDENPRFEPGPTAGVDILLVEPGPTRRRFLTTIARLQPGACFEQHDHFGAEQALVLDGGYDDSVSGPVFRGQRVQNLAGTAHSLTAMQGRPCLILLALEMAPADEE